jgi:hypothetical protein
LELQVFGLESSVNSTGEFPASGKVDRHNE